MDDKRIACALIDNFPLAVFIKEDPTLINRPLVVTESDSDSAAVLAVNEIAFEEGVTRAVTAAQANSLCDKLVIRVRDEEKEKTVSDKLLAILQTISPFIESEITGGEFYLDASGLNYLYKDERGLAHRIIAAINRTGYPVRVGIARNKFVARAAAETSLPNRQTIIPDGCEQTFLNRLNASHLHLSDETSRTLADLGLKTIGQLAAFPTNEMTQRFGEEGKNLARLSRGKGTRFFLPEQPTDNITGRHCLTSSIYHAGSISGHIERMLISLFPRLRHLGLGCRTIAITLYLEDKTEQSLTIAVDKPTLKTGSFIRQLHTAIERLKLNSGLMEIRLSFPETSPLEPEQIQTQQIKSSAATQVGNIGWPTYQAGSAGWPTIHGGMNPTGSQRTNRSIYKASLNPSILPETSFRLSNISSADSSRTDRPTICSQTSHRVSHPYCRNMITGLRLVQPPQKTNVTLREGQPRLVSIGARHETVAELFGPWELSGRWWSRSFNRLYYEFQIADRRRYLLFFDCLNTSWFIQGVFD